jgi:cation diffusion facilitator family transporter
VIAESVQALFDPRIIAFRESMGVATLGLGVNLLSAYLLRGDAHEHGHASHHGHSHSHDPADGHGHSHEHVHHADQAEADVNRKAAFAHVVVDAMTSVLAILALAADRYLGWRMLDPLVGVVGGLIIARWSLSLIGGALPLPLDRDPSPRLSAAIRKRLEAEPDTEVTDLHVWQVAPGERAAVVAVLTHGNTDAGRYKVSLADFGLAHLSVAVNRCADCAAQGSRSAG